MKPSDKDAGLLTDMLKACRETLEFSRGVQLDQFMDNPQLCRAIERCLEILGEAASRISLPFAQQHPEIAWQEIKGLRNVLAHEYGQVDYEILYRTVQEDVPLLAIQIMRIIGVGPANLAIKERRAIYDLIKVQTAGRPGHLTILTTAKCASKDARTNRTP